MVPWKNEMARNRRIIVAILDATFHNFFFYSDSSSFKGQARFVRCRTCFLKPCPRRHLVHTISGSEEKHPSRYRADEQYKYVLHLQMTFFRQSQATSCVWQS